MRRVHSVTLFSWDHFIYTAKEAMENHSDKKEECRKWMIGIQGWKRCRDWHGDGTALWCMQRSKRMQKTFNVLHDELLVSSSSPLNLIQEIIDIKLQWNVYWKVHRHLLLSCNLCWEVPSERYLFPEGYEELRLQFWELYVIGCFCYLGKKLTWIISSHSCDADNQTALERFCGKGRPRITLAAILYMQWRVSRWWWLQSHILAPDD